MPKIYTRRQREHALYLLRESEGNYAAVAAQMHIPNSTLRSWWSAYRNQSPLAANKYYPRCSKEASYTSNTDPTTPSPANIRDKLLHQLDKLLKSPTDDPRKAYYIALATRALLEQIKTLNDIIDPAAMPDPETPPPAESAPQPIPDTPAETDTDAVSHTPADPIPDTLPPADPIPEPAPHIPAHPPRAEDLRIVPLPPNPEANPEALTAAFMANMHTAFNFLRQISTRDSSVSVRNPAHTLSVNVGKTNTTSQHAEPDTPPPATPSYGEVSFLQDL